MTPKKNGNVTVVKIEGLTYLYRGTPYVLVIYCAITVYELVSNAVGGLPKSSTCKVGDGTILDRLNESFYILLMGTYIYPHTKSPLT